MSCRSFASYLPPTFLILLLIWSYYSYVVEFCINFLDDRLKKCAYLIVYHVIVLMFLWSFFQTVLEPHDIVPYEYRLTFDEHIRLSKFDQTQSNLILQKLIQLRKLEVYTSSDTGYVRYCIECHLIKPDRTHHCSTCKMCVLKMDHHCPWVFNCVGYSNYKQFVLMLMYGSMLCIFYMGSIVEYIAEFFRDILSNLSRLHLCIGFFAALLTGIITSALFVYHVGLVFKNETTLETMREVTFINIHHTFDLGPYKNFINVFGRNCCLWPFPIRTALDNGYEFSVRTWQV